VAAVFIFSGAITLLAVALEASPGWGGLCSRRNCR
jgi:hypothetical protein